MAEVCVPPHSSMDSTDKAGPLLRIFPKQGNGTHLSCFFQGNVLQRILDYVFAGSDHSQYVRFSGFLRGFHPGIMRKIETQSHLGRHLRPFLFNLQPEHLSERIMKQVGGEYGCLTSGLPPRSRSTVARNSVSGFSGAFSEICRIRLFSLMVSLTGIFSPWVFSR